jgi:hypothetical protein
MTSEWLEREAQHDAAIARGDFKAAKALRNRARRIAVQRGERIPNFAALRLAPRPARQPAAPVVAVMSQLDAPESHATVRDWARAGDRALSFGADGSVTLIRFGAGQRRAARFASEALALEAVARATVTWGPLGAPSVYSGATGE